MAKLGLAKAGRLAGAVALVLAAPLLQGSTGLRTNLDARLLAAHNRERAAAGIPELNWDPALVEDARRWGDYLAAVGALEHEEDDADDPNPQGENLFLGTKNYFAPEEMVGMWVDEKRFFKPGAIPENSRSGNFDDVGHYTQLMWRDTKHVGCAVSQGSDYDILVCRYSQAGNVMGEQPF